MFNSINVKFYVLKSKQSRSGFAPLTLTIIVNGERSRIILPRKLNPKDFNAKKQLATDPEINNFISVVRTKIMQIHTQLITTPDSFQKIVYALGLGIFSRYKCIVDEIHCFQKDAGYRESLRKFMDGYFKSFKCKSVITATYQELENPMFSD